MGTGIFCQCGQVFFRSEPSDLPILVSGDQAKGPIYRSISTSPRWDAIKLQGYPWTVIKICWYPIVNLGGEKKSEVSCPRT